MEGVRGLDFATVGGILLALVSLVLAFIFDGGTIASLLQPTAALIVFGGTLGATLTTVSLRDFGSILKYLRVALFHKPKDPLDVVDEIVELGTVARREGLLALDDTVGQLPEGFFRNGMQLVIDGVDPELVKSMLETEMSYIETRHEQAARIFESAGGFAPTMGIIGTVMGLVHVLSSLSDVNSLGPKIAVAFIATLYGVASANIFWLPIAQKLKLRNEEEILLFELQMEGILSIQNGENPKVLSQKLKEFLSPDQRDRKADKNAGGVEGVVAEEASRA